LVRLPSPENQSGYRQRGLLMIEPRKKIEETSAAPDAPQKIDTLPEVESAGPNILEDFNAEKMRLEDTQRAVLNILDDFSIEKGNLESTQKATLNILEDFNAEKTRLEDTQRAVLNILDDFAVEKGNLEGTQKATLNILEDFNAEKTRLEDTQRAVLNILDDFDDEKNHLERTQKASFNILEDFDDDRRHLHDTQRAILNILEDLNQSNEDLKKAHDVLETRVRERTAELARSNAELEQFAYIASHDLQEPLRMISSYVQLLERRYKGQLDPDADEFIGYAADGALRMQRMINDLLAYSRVGTRGKSFERIDLETVLAQAIKNLHLSIKEKNATVTFERLPAVYGDAGQLTQVFQNLIDNALKFHGDEPPEVHVSASIQKGECTCSIRDNGIGIAPEYQSRLFLLFQRLHTRQEYPGTGIGLAICKRIVERHGGKIWIESMPGEGSTFYFQIPTTQRSYYSE
jgi:signal transduction histidine kinase